MILDYQQKFATALDLAQRGQSSQSLKIFQQINEKGQQNYCSLVNLGVLYLQQGKISQAQTTLKKATYLDRYQYLAYYNLFILYYQLLQTQSITTKSSSTQQHTKYQIYHYLHLSLSCAYAQLAQTTKDLKLCTKSINFCQQNSSAYVTRAYLYQLNQQPKLAQNDYASAISYAPNNHLFYMKRSEFLCRWNRRQQATKDIRKYWQLKNLKRTHNSPPQKQLQSKQITQDQILKFNQQIIQKILQLQSIFTKLQQANQYYDPNQQQNIATFLPTNQSKQISKLNPLPQKPQNNDSLFLDESSKNISQQIQKLQNQIRLQGGKLHDYPFKQKSLSHDQILLTQQIQKTSQEIQCFQQLHPTPISKTNSSLCTNNHHFNLNNQLLANTIVNVDQLHNYHTIILQIQYAKMFDINSLISKINVKYNHQQKSTQYSKNYQWNTQFQFTINHDLHKIYQSSLIDSQNQLPQGHQKQLLFGQILLELQVKTISTLPSKKIIGIGHINIQCLGENKCILSNDKEKSGIVYYQIQLQ